VLKFTGTLTADVTVTLPTPGMWVIDNQTVAGAFVLIFRGATSTQVVGAPPGEIFEIYNDGANVRFVGLGRMGKLEFWEGITSMPRWVTECTVKPYLYCDGTASYLISDYPQLGARNGSSFGGNGITTFGVPDLRGRLPLAYDGTGTRITAALCGVNGQTMGAAGGVSGEALARAYLPNTVVAVSVSDPGHNHAVNGVAILAGGNNNNGGGGGAFGAVTSSSGTTTASSFTGISASFNLNGGVTQTVLSNLPPAQVAGIWVVKT
jgi:microcystin-dependent protein